MISKIKSLFATPLGRAVVHILVYAAAAIVVVVVESVQSSIDFGQYQEFAALVLGFVIDAARKLQQ